MPNWALVCHCRICGSQVVLTPDSIGEFVSFMDEHRHSKEELQKFEKSWNRLDHKAIYVIEKI